jgi:calpain-15
MGGCCQKNPEKGELLQPLNESKKRKVPTVNHRRNFKWFNTFKEAMDAYDKIVEELETSKKKWTDNEFPPVFGETIRTSKQYFYKRISEILSHEPTVFDDINPNDIQQGALGDCYFLSALSALAETPSRVMSLFITTEASKHGIYMVRLCIYGIWRYFLLDDYFPVTSTGRLAFSRCVGNEIWVLLLEKAYAKLYGSYEAIVAGDPCEAMNDLSGAPNISVELGANPEELWTKLKNYDEKNYLMAFNFNESPDLKKMGLIVGHAYTLIGIKELKHKGEEQRLVKIRNPWGRFEWNGDWSDKSEKWTKELKKIAEFDDKNDGVFWMSIADCFRLFDELHVCKYFDDYATVGVQIDHQNCYVGGKAFFFEFTCDLENHGFISANNETADSYNVCFINLLVVNESGTEPVTVLAHDKGMERNVEVEFETPPGRYIVLVYLPSSRYPATLSVYSRYLITNLKQVKNLPPIMLSTVLQIGVFT